LNVDTEVLVVGGGPVGLALAIELGMRGVRVIVAERNERGGVAPRAKTTNVRTRTHLRRWGIADKLAQASPMGVDYPAHVKFVTSLAGYPLAEFTNQSNMSPEQSPLYPEHGQWVPQYVLERIMLEHARTLSDVDIRFGLGFVSATLDLDFVSAILADASGDPCTVTARYLVGADGARSTVRELIGAKMEGRYGLGRSYNIIVRAPGLSQAHTQGAANMYWQLGPSGLSVTGPMDRDDVWYFGPAGIGEHETLSDQEAVDRITKATGIALPYEIISADKWVASELLADRYSDGRILLAGDACHVHPPFGGYGLNMGIGDGVDLGWKIAATLQGWGGPALIDSYEIERRPLHKAVIDEAVINHQIVGAPPVLPEAIEHDTPEGAAIRDKLGRELQATKGREFHTLGTVLGLSYRTSPIVALEDWPWPEHDSEVYTPSARPGSLAPHAWLADGRSLYDLFGAGFTLLVLAGANDGDVANAERDAEANGVPLTVIRPDAAVLMELYGSRLTLIRPDQHVAWRGDRWQPVLPKVTGFL
jgi:2-polyprenyl-6-methoxyphenol hydroxylase-like FAD-dependent oxidoreductase